MNEKARLLIRIFLTFFKISPVTFGGGYAMVPLIEREVLERHKWMNEKELTDVFALAETVPGAVAVNSAMMIGYRLAGTTGAAVAMIGVCLPTFLIVLALGILYLYLQKEWWVASAMEGVRAAVIALILYAAVHIGKHARWDRKTRLLLCLSFAVLLLLHIHPLFVIAGGAVVGILLKFRVRRKFFLRLKKAVNLENEKRESKAG
jgi:chromate transporter